MTSSNTVGVANSECITVEPNIVPAVDTLLVDSPMAPEVVAAQANESAGKIEEGLERENKLRPWYKTPSVWWYVNFQALVCIYLLTICPPGYCLSLPSRPCFARRLSPLVLNSLSSLPAMSCGPNIASMRRDGTCRGETSMLVQSKCP